jgi:putative NIF3 family GTP cyclohydrolase 1 type 2
MLNRMNRRTFGAALSAGLLGPAFAEPAPAAPLTAGEVIDRVKKQLAARGVTWQERPAGPSGAAGPATVDTYKLGDPATPVTGVATCWQSTFEELRKAAARKLNLIITHEPTFWNHLDETQAVQEDPVYRAKREFAEQHRMVIWRFHDHWHRVKPDPIAAALGRRLGWERSGSGSGFDALYVLPHTTLAAAARQVQERLGTRCVRIVGDPQQPVSRVAVAAHMLSSCLRAMRNADAVLMCEPREFDTFEYSRDALRLGQGRGIMGISHDRTEEWGMREPCAGWIRSFVPEVPVEPVAVDDWFWVAEPRRGESR